MLDGGDVGRRVVVRRQAGTGPHGRAVYTDILGELLAIDGQWLVVRSDDATEHRVARTDVVAAKRVPPRPARYSEIATLEQVASQAWPAPVQHRLGEWLLRAASGFSNRANSALPLGDAGMPLDAAIDACERWYRTQQLTPRINVPLPLRRDVATALSRRGWLARPPVAVQTAPLTALLAESAVPAGSMVAGAGSGLHVELSEHPSPDLVRRVAAAKNGPLAAVYDVLTARHVTPPPVADGAEADGAETAEVAVQFAEIREGGRLLALGRGAVVRRWLHLSLVETAERARRQGHARRVTRALAEWATTRGAVRTLLQVEHHNQAAIGLYASMGFTTHHRYVTYRRYEH